MLFLAGGDRVQKTQFIIISSLIHDAENKRAELSSCLKYEPTGEWN